MSQVLCTSYHAIRILKYLPRTLLRRILEPHADALRCVGIELDEADEKRLWKEWERLPRALVECFFHLHEMSETAGQHGLRAAAERAGIALPVGELPIVIAANLLVNSPELLQQVRAVLSGASMSSFRELCGARQEPHRPIGDIEAAQQLLLDSFVKHGISSYCRLRVWREGELLCFLVHYASWQKAEQELCDGRVTTHKGCPILHDLVAIDTRMGRMRLSAHDRKRRAIYTHLFGQLLFDDETWFRQAPVVDLEPIRELQPHLLLAPTQGLSTVRLLGLEMACEDLGGIKLQVEGENLERVLSAPLPQLHHSALLAARFAFLPRGERCWQTMELRVPNLIAGGWHSDAVGRSFFEQRGLLVR